MSLMKVYITGGSAGIGQGLAEIYAQQGHDVCICGRSPQSLPEGFLEKYPTIKYDQIDVTNYEALKKSVDDFADGRLDLMIANAGISLGEGAGARPNFDDSKRIIEVNVIGFINAFQAAFPIMEKQNNGQMVAIASVAGFNGLPGAASYCGSKSAVIKMCETFAIDFKNFGISVSAICPGYIDTRLTRKNKFPMPFLLTQEKGCRMIKKAIDQKKALYLFPLPMKLTILFLTLMPRGLYRFIMGKVLGSFTRSGLKKA
jgi:short-subunit dehydrogenase